MKALKSLIVLVVSLGLAVSAFGDTQSKSASKTDKSAQKQQKQLKQDAKQADKTQKSGLKKVFRNPFKRQPKSQEADCRKYPNAAGCPNAKQDKQMAKQVSAPEPKTVKQSTSVKHPKPVQKQAFKPAKKNAKAGKATGKSKAPVKKAHTVVKPKVQAKNQGQTAIASK